MEHVFCKALLDQDEATLSDVLRLLSDKDYRIAVGRQVGHLPVLDFWLKEYPQYSYRYRANAIAPIQNKIGAFLSDPLLYRY